LEKTKSKTFWLCQKASLPIRFAQGKLWKRQKVKLSGSAKKQVCPFALLRVNFGKDKK